jgi:hypothetical protein
MLLPKSDAGGGYVTRANQWRTANASAVTE